MPPDLDKPKPVYGSIKKPKSVSMPFRAFLFIILFSSTNLNASYSKPVFEHGVLDLRGTQPSEWKEIILKGEWEFYWNQLLSPKDFKNSPPWHTNYINAPCDWNKQVVDGIEIPGTGYATYRSFILTDSIDEKLAIFISNIGTASKLYVNGKNIYNAGIPGKTAKTSVPTYNPEVCSFYPTSDTLELVLQVSNFHYARGGYWNNKALFGLESKIKHDYEKRVRLSLLITGGMLFFALYMLFHFLLDLRQKFALFFSLVCIQIAARVLVIDEIILLDFFPTLNWNWLVRIEYLTIPIGALTLNLFTSTFFPDEYNKAILKIIIILGSLLGGIILFTPPLFFTKYLFAIQIFIILACSYVIYIVIKALQNKRDGALKFLFSFILLTIVFFNDILYANEVVGTGYKTSWGAIVFITVLAQMLAARYRYLFKQSENLSQKLEFLNYDLESRVVDRTSQIEQQNILLKNKNKEIEKINLTKDKFYAIIAHDLRNPISAIYQLMETINDNFDDYSLDEIKDLIENIRFSSKETYDLLENLLEWATLQQGRIHFHPTSVNIAEQIESSILLLKSNANQKKIVIEAPSGNSFIALADIDMVTVIIRNLLNNAIKFSKEDSKIVFDITSSVNNWKISVRDYGIGIDKKDFDMLFKPRDKRQDIGKSKQKGTGLGLVLCKEFVERNGGEIWVESKIEKGTTFYFTLPKKNN